MADQRKSKRFDLRLPLELVRGSRHQGLLSGETENISSSGVLFQANGTLEIGDPIEYYITLPTAPSPNERLRLRCVGKVIRVAGTPDPEATVVQVAATMERYEFTRQRIASKAV